MKTILYILIAAFIFGILATGFSQKSKTEQKFLIQSTDQNLSEDAFQRSVEIITSRLKSYGDAKFKVTPLPDRKQIQVTTTGDWDAKATERIITQKGRLEFYETWNHKQITTLLNDDGRLSTLLHDQTSNDSSAKLGCVSLPEMDKVNAYLTNAGLDQQCKFAWSNLFDDSEVCLYALKLKNGDGVLLSGSDIEYFSRKFEKSLNKDSFEFKFKTSAIGTWAEITKRNINSAIAIVIDDAVIHAPVVRSEITGGDCQVTGDFTTTQVRYIVAIGANGELPAGFKIVK